MYGGDDIDVLELVSVMFDPTHTLLGPLIAPPSVNAYTVLTIVAVAEPQLLVTV